MPLRSRSVPAAASPMLVLLRWIVAGLFLFLTSPRTVHSFGVGGGGDLLAGLTGRAPDALSFPENLLDGTNIDPSSSRVDLACTYKASRDGWSAIDFHEAVDSGGSALVVCLSKSGKKFGGYCPTVRVCVCA